MSDTLTTTGSPTENLTAQENLDTNEITEENIGNQESSGSPENIPKEDTNNTKPYDVQDVLNKEVLPTLERLKQAIELALKEADLASIKKLVEIYITKLEKSDKSMSELVDAYTELLDNLNNNKSNIEKLVALYEAKIAELESSVTTKVDSLVTQVETKINQIEVSSKKTLDDMIKEYRDNLDSITTPGASIEVLKSKLNKTDYEADKLTFALKSELKNKTDELTASLNTKTDELTNSLNTKTEELTNSLNSKTEELTNILNEGLNTKLDTSSLVGELGQSESLIVNQKALSEALNLKANKDDAKPTNILLDVLTSPIGITTLGTQFFCKKNRNQYILIDNEGIDENTILEDLIYDEKAINITPSDFREKLKGINYILNHTDHSIAGYPLLVKDGEAYWMQCATSEQNYNDLDRFKKLPLPKISSIKDAFASKKSVCILFKNGELWVCGISGILGLGRINDKIYTPVLSATDVEEMFCNLDTFNPTCRTLIRKKDGYIYVAGVLGSGTRGVFLNWAKLDNLGTDVKTVYNFSEYLPTTFIKNDNTIIMYGYNETGLMGTGSTSEGGLDFTDMTEAWGGKELETIDIQCRFFGLDNKEILGTRYKKGHLLMLRKDKSDKTYLYACGDSVGYGLCLENATTTPKLVENSSDIKQVKCTRSHTFVLKTDGTVWGCGDNEYNELGSSVSRNQKTLVNIASGVKRLLSFGWHTEAIILEKDDGYYTCGTNLQGQCGVGHTNRVNNFTKMGFNSDVKLVSIGGYGSFTHFALDDKGRLWSWGMNIYSNLGESKHLILSTSSSKYITTPTLINFE